MKQFLSLAFCMAMFSCQGQKVITLPPDTTTISITQPVQDNSGKFIVNGFARVSRNVNAIILPAIRLPAIPPVIVTVRDTSIAVGTIIQVIIAGPAGTQPRIYNAIVDSVSGNGIFTRPYP